MTFQIETTAVCEVCFLPEKHKRLQKISKESTNSVITNIIRDKETEFRLTNFSIIKPKTTEQIISEILYIEFVDVKVKVLSAAYQKTLNSLKLREYVATDDRESFINITIFEELIDEVNIDMTYSILCIYDIDMTHDVSPVSYVK